MRLRTLRPWLLGLVAVVVLLFVVVLEALLSFRPDAVEDVRVDGRATSTPAEIERPTLRLMTWNIGYAGLGREADFFADGGESRRPESADVVRTNLVAIRRQVAQAECDVLLIQEVAAPSFLTRGVDVRGELVAALIGHAYGFTPTIAVPKRLGLGGLTVGKMTLSRWPVAEFQRFALPGAKDVLGIQVQHFNMMTARIPGAAGDPGWLIANIHLSAFDEGGLRLEQLAAVIARLEQFHAEGLRVIAGGDWNLRLEPSEFPHTTTEANRFWVRDMPVDILPAGWRWVADPNAPTCRTLERPYREGENYTLIIDGFLVSPDVEVVDVRTVPLGFEHSDHEPVMLEVRGR